MTSSMFPPPDDSMLDDGGVDVMWLLKSLGPTAIGPAPMHEVPNLLQPDQLLKRLEVPVGASAPPLMMTSCLPSPTDSERCWGAEVSGVSSKCVQSFKPGKAHFKNKFCQACMCGLELPASRVRALTQDLTGFISNTNSSGFWKTHRAEVGGGIFRVINNTSECVGPQLAIFLGEAPSQLAWGEMPREWISGDTVRLAVAKGTLVPAASLGARAHRSSSSRVPNATKRQRGSIDEGSADGDVLDEGPRGRKLFLFRPTVGLIHAGPGDAVPSPGGASTGVPLFGVAASSSLFGISDTESSASVASRGRPPALHAPLEEAFAVAESDAMGDAMGNPTSVEAVLEQLEAAHAQVVAATRAALALPAGVGSRERAALESQRRHAQLAAASVKRWRRAAADDESERSSTGAPSLPSLPGTPESSGRASLPPPALPDLRSPISEIGFAELSTESTKERGAFMERARTNPKDEPLTIQEVSLTSACITKAATKGPHPAGAEPADAPAVHPLMRLGISDSLLQHKKGRRRALQGNLLRMFRGATISTPRANPSAGQDAMESEDSPKAKDMQGSAGPSWWRGLRK